MMKEDTAVVVHFHCHRLLLADEITTCCGEVLLCYI